jgi:hypothetical protein
LAHALAGAIGCPAICRDELKEGMVASTPGFRAGPNDLLTGRTYDLFFAVLDLLLAAEVSLVAEAAFQHSRWTAGLARLRADQELRVVQCVTDPAEARSRMQRRLQTQPTRAAHGDADHLAAAAGFQAIQVDAPTLRVDTSAGYAPELANVVRFCRR